MPKTIILIGLIFIGLASAFVPQLYKDTTADAFIAKDNPALIYKNKVKEVFGCDIFIRLEGVMLLLSCIGIFVAFSLTQITGNSLLVSASILIFS